MIWYNKEAVSSLIFLKLRFLTFFTHFLLSLDKYFTAFLRHFLQYLIALLIYSRTNTKARETFYVICANCACHHLKKKFILTRKIKKTNNRRFLHLFCFKRCTTLVYENNSLPASIVFYLNKKNTWTFEFFPLFLVF